MLDHKRKHPKKKWEDLPGFDDALVTPRRLNQLYKTMPPPPAEPAPLVAQALKMTDGAKDELDNKCLHECAKSLNAAIAERVKVKKKSLRNGTLPSIIKRVQAGNPLWAGTYTMAVRRRAEALLNPKEKKKADRNPILPENVEIALMDVCLQADKSNCQLPVRDFPWRWLPT